MIYHATHESFKQFHNRPTWFSLSTRDANGWHESGISLQGKQITLICEFNGKIASLDDAAEIAKQVWPDSDLIYSMYDTNVNEFAEHEVKTFINLMIAAGFDGAYIDDYDPTNFEQGNTTSLCIFEPKDKVKIVEVATCALN